MRRNGGPAFPRPAGWNGLSNFEEHSSNEPQDGMTLRDYFAVHAPPMPSDFRGGTITLIAMVEWRWYWAEEMLAQREKG